MRPGWVGMIVMGWLGCAHHEGKGRIDPVAMQLVEVRPAKPPLERLFLEATLHNPEPSPRWFLIPSAIGTPRGRGVDALATYRVGPGVQVGRFLGTAGFYAVKIPAGGWLKLGSLEVGRWQDGGAPRDKIALEVATASDLRVGGEPAERWFPVDPLCAKDVDARGQAWTPLGTRRAAGGKEVEVTKGDEAAIPVEVRAPSPPILRSARELASAQGRRVRVEGVLQRAKLGDSIEIGGVPLFCLDTRFPDVHLGKRLVIEGTPERTTAVEAHVNERGEWTAGTPPGSGGAWVLHDCVKVER